MVTLATRTWEPNGSLSPAGTDGLPGPVTATATTAAAAAARAYDTGDGDAGDTADTGDRTASGPSARMAPNGEAGRAGGGDQPPLAVLVHGITSSSNTWWEVGPALAERGWRVIGVDLRGHGASPRGVAGLVLDDLAVDLAETVRSRPVDLLVGHSLGALVAMAALTADPGFARRVVLEDPPCAESFDGTQMAADIERDARWVRRAPGVFRRALIAPPDRMRPADADAKIANLLALDVDGVTGALRHGVGFDVVELARAVPVPALLYLGEERLGSALTGPARADVATALAQGWTEVVPCGHSIHRDAFDSFMRRLDAWLDRVGAQPTSAR
jgi:pimeloyl-ACP methyl ester carboxylesterase